VTVFPWSSTAWPSIDALAAAFVPQLIQIEGLLAVIVAGLIMLMLGRAILGPRILPEIALIAGWGIVCLVLTLWGVSTPLTLRIPAAALVAVAAATAFIPRGELSRVDLSTLKRLFVLALPLVAVFAAAYPSGPDSFTNQVPNAAYLHDFGQFPAINRSPMLALWPAFPYNLQLAAFLPGLLTASFPPNLLTHVNLLLEFAFALLLARSMRGPQSVGSDAPTWSAIAGALLLTTFLNPGFNPKIQFSSYGDPTIAVTVAFAAWQSERLLAALAAKSSAAEERLALVCILLAGVAIKQVSVFLMGSVVAVAFLIGTSDRRIGAGRAFGQMVIALLPALLLLGVWRFYVGAHFAAGDELRFLPFGEWHLGSLRAILSNMGFRIWQRLPFFLLLYGVSFAAIPLALIRGPTPAVRLFLLTLGVTLLYTVFLIFTYVSHFPGEIGASAHSFFRYNLHLGLLATLAIVAFARESWLRRGAPDLGRGWRLVGASGIVLVLIAPIVASGWLRSDLRAPEPLVWGLARFTAPNLMSGDQVALLLPGDNRSVALMLRVAIAVSRPHRGPVGFDDFPRADSAALSEAHDRGDGIVLISCVTPALAASPAGQALKLPQGQAALLARDGAKWRLVEAHPYPAALPPIERWTPELSPGPFCR